MTMRALGTFVLAAVAATTVLLVIFLLFAAPLSGEEIAIACGSGLFLAATSVVAVASKGDRTGGDRD